MFQFLYNLESKKSKDKLDDHLISFRLSVTDDNDTAPPPLSVLSPSPPLERKIFPNLSPSMQKRYGVSSNLESNLKVASSRNPKNYPPNNSSLYPADILNLYAKKYGVQ